MKFNMKEIFAKRDDLHKRLHESAEHRNWYKFLENTDLLEEDIIALFFAFIDLNLAKDEIIETLMKIYKDQ